jgi:hypothetical protein
LTFVIAQSKFFLKKNFSAATKVAAENQRLLSLLLFNPIFFKKKKNFSAATNVVAENGLSATTLKSLI